MHGKSSLHQFEELAVQFVDVKSRLHQFSPLMVRVVHVKSSLHQFEALAAQFVYIELGLSQFTTLASRECTLAKTTLVTVLVARGVTTKDDKVSFSNSGRINNKPVHGMQ